MDAIIRPDREASMSMQNHSVAIIGAGIVGLCTAHALRKAGWQVTVFDAQDPGSQCSFGNAGALSEGSVAPLAMPGVIKQAASMLLDSTSALHVPLGYLLPAMPWFARFIAASRPERVRQIATALHDLLAGSVRHHTELASDIGCAHLIKTTGQLHLYPDAGSRDKDKASWQLKSDFGLAMQPVDRATIAELEPAVSDAYRSGWFLPDEGWVSDPFQYSQALARANTDQGVAFVNAGISHLRRSNDKWHLVSGEQSWQADHVVVCAGMGSRTLLATLNLSVPLESQRGYHLQAPHPGVTLSRIVVLADRKIFMNPMQGQLRIAGTVEFGGINKPMNEQRALLLKDHALAGLDNLNTSGFTTWLGHRPCLPDSLPVIGPVADLPGLWTGFGHGHLGLTGSVNTGRLLARAMAGQASANELAPFSLSRFS